MDPQPPESPQTPPPAIPPADPVMPAPPGDATLPPEGPVPSQPWDGARPRRGRRILAAVLVAAVVLLGGGAAAAFFAMRGSNVEVLAFVPASTDVVVTAYLDPSASQKLNLFQLAHRFPALANGQELRSQVNDALDQALAPSGLDHTDVLGWIGSQAAVAVDLNPDTGSTSVAVMVASTDDGLAASTLRKGIQKSGGALEQRDYRGVTVSFNDSSAFAILDHVVVISDDPAVIDRAIDTARGTIPNLAEDPTYLDTISALPAGKLGLVYVNPADFVNGLGAVLADGSATGVPGLSTLRAMRGIALSLSAQPDGISIDSTIRYDPSKLDAATRQQLDAPTHENATLAFVPSDALAVVAQQNVDATLKQAVDQVLTTPEGERLRAKLGVDNAISALTGDVSLEVGGGGAGSVLGSGALVIGVSDPTSVQHTLDQLANLAVASQTTAPVTPGLSKQQQRQLNGLLEPSPSWKTTTYHGATIRYLLEPSLALSGFMPAYTVVDGAAIIASSPGEIRKLLDTKAAGSDVTTSPSYTRALARVPTGGSSFYVDMAGIVSEMSAFLPPEVRQNLEPVKTIVAGGQDSSTRSTFRFFVEIR
jgi:hypothetical protein